MKARSNRLQIGWAVGGIAPATAFFVAWYKHGGKNPWSDDKAGNRSLCAEGITRCTVIGA